MKSFKRGIRRKRQALSSIWLGNENSKKILPLGGRKLRPRRGTAGEKRGHEKRSRSKTSRATKVDGGETNFFS